MVAQPAMGYYGFYGEPEQMYGQYDPGYGPVGSFTPKIPTSPINTPYGEVDPYGCGYGCGYYAEPEYPTVRSSPATSRSATTPQKILISHKMYPLWRSRSPTTTVTTPSLPEIAMASFEPGYLANMSRLATML